MLALCGVEAERAGDGFEDAGGYPSEIAAFEFGVVLDADPGESGDFATTEPGNSALAVLW